MPSTTLPPYLTPGLADAAVHTFSGGLPHTYTRTPVAVGAPDVWARRVKTSGTPVTGVRCRYLPRTQVVTTDEGRVLTTTPPHHGGTLASLQTLTVLPDDPLAVDDQVSDIRDSRGRVLLTGPASVIADIPHAGFGPATLRMLVLRGETAEHDV
jgi:hypothetical protein